MGKYMHLLANLFVGLTFLLSGAVKLNDLRGFAYKIEEYLYLLAGRMATHVHRLLPYTLALAVSIATLEVALGAAMLVYWQYFWTLRILLLLTLFFTCLTLYTATSRRMAHCGCFGDALVLTPWQSFTKSSILLCVLGGLCWQAKYTPTNANSYYWMATTLLFSLGLGRYTLRHLPLLDLLPYKVGSDLTQLVPQETPLRHVHMAAKKSPSKAAKHRTPTLDCQPIAPQARNPRDRPEATQLCIWQGEKEVTQALLTGRKLLVVTQDPACITTPTLQNLSILVQQLQAALEPILLAANNQGQKVAEALGLPLHTAHPLLLRTMLRAELGLLLLNDGQVMGKWHFNDIQRTKDPRHLFCYK